MHLVVVRHAHAGRRSEWDAEDSLRPLSPKGELQAAHLAATLAPLEPKVIVSSPAVRCVQTVTPLARLLGVELTIDRRLAEGARPDRAMDLIGELSGSTAVVCSHGDLIPEILDGLVTQGMAPERPLKWQKGSAWVIERNRDAFGTGRYVPPVSTA